jgi:hypothetical protein
LRAATWTCNFRISRHPSTEQSYCAEEGFRRHHVRGILEQSKNGEAPHASGGSTMIHDLFLALVFLSMIIAPAFVAMRSDNEPTDF